MDNQGSFFQRQVTGGPVLLNMDKDLLYFTQRLKHENIKTSLTPSRLPAAGRPSPQKKHKANNIKYMASLRLCVRIDLGIFSAYDYLISTGPLERANNKSKTMKWQAYGFRDKEFSKSKIMAIHNTRYALLG